MGGLEGGQACRLDAFWMGDEGWGSPGHLAFKHGGRPRGVWAPPFQAFSCNHLALQARGTTRATTHPPRREVTRSLPLSTHCHGPKALLGGVPAPRNAVGSCPKSTGSRRTHTLTSLRSHPILSQSRSQDPSFQTHYRSCPSRCRSQKQSNKASFITYPAFCPIDGAMARRSALLALALLACCLSSAFGRRPCWLAAWLSTRAPMHNNIIAHPAGSPYCAPVPPPAGQASYSLSNSTAPVIGDAVAACKTAGGRLATYTIVSDKAAVDGFIVSLERAPRTCLAAVAPRKIRRAGSPVTSSQNSLLALYRRMALLLSSLWTRLPSMGRAPSLRLLASWPSSLAPPLATTSAPSAVSGGWAFGAGSMCPVRVASGSRQGLHAWCAPHQPPEPAQPPPCCSTAHIACATICLL